MQIEQVHYTFKAHATYGFSVLFLATMLPAFSAATRAQQAVGTVTPATGRNAILAAWEQPQLFAADSVRLSDRCVK